MSRNAGDSWKEINQGLASSVNQVRDNVADNLFLTPDDDTLLLGRARATPGEMGTSRVSLRAYVCPRCGYVEQYVRRLGADKKIINARASLINAK